MDTPNRLDVGDTGPASMLRIGDSFVFVDNGDGRDHVVTDDEGSHLEYDGRPNKRLSKDTVVRRSGERDPGEALERVKAALHAAVLRLERDADVAAWSNDVGDVVSRASADGFEGAIQPLEKLSKQGTAQFSKLRSRHGKNAVDTMPAHERKRWQVAVEAAQESLHEGAEDLRSVVSEIIRQCGDKWCLYTKHKGPNGKRRRLGTHSSRAGAVNQEKAIKAHGG